MSAPPAGSWRPAWRLSARGAKFAKFMAVGLPAFALAVPLNYLFVRGVGLSKPLAYALVLVVQTTANFFLCRFLVFEKRSATPLLTEFAAFFTGVLGFRLADWLVYVLLVKVFGLYFMAVQIGNVVIFSVLKFLFVERILR